ncbi:hypothetical protein ATN84_01785 [Paramesorhizobium deserti]|uniref:Uncharacterized protein n=1 Tax=Paramesorhizobium deserti TaxID=1494590 RepID=A0A135HZG6_9HYPH|nr:hypothetical protein [Paramesorhizobium deserti]KXF78548.1 hypothetical protein ATN84_01785 [Paramesorhizobium deserti]
MSEFSEADIRQIDRYIDALPAKRRGERAAEGLYLMLIEALEKELATQLAVDTSDMDSEELAKHNQFIANIRASLANA